MFVAQIFFTVYTVRYVRTAQNEMLRPWLRHITKCMNLQCEHFVMWRNETFASHTAALPKTRRAAPSDCYGINASALHLVQGLFFVPLVRYFYPKNRIEAFSSVLAPPFTLEIIDMLLYGYGIRSRFKVERFRRTHELCIGSCVSCVELWLPVLMKVLRSWVL